MEYRVFRCSRCGKIQSSAAVRWKCLGCGKTGAWEKSGFVQVYIYAGNLTAQEASETVKYLKKKGFENARRVQRSA